MLDTPFGKVSLKHFRSLITFAREQGTVYCFDEPQAARRVTIIDHPLTTVALAHSLASIRRLGCYGKRGSSPQLGFASSQEKRVRMLPVASAMQESPAP